MPSRSRNQGANWESLPVRFLTELCEQRKLPALFIGGRWYVDPAAAVDALRDLSGACEALDIIAAAREVKADD